MANVSIKLANPLTAEAATTVGLFPREYQVGEQVTVTDAAARSLTAAGYVDTGGSGTSYPVDPYILHLNQQAGVLISVDVSNPATVARPPGAARVAWIGGVTRPNAMVNGDIWIKAST